MRAVTLLDNTATGGATRHVTARLTDEGALVVEGQDLGGAAKEIFGAFEYEWAVTVAAGHVPAVLEALGEPRGSDVLAALARRFAGDRAGRIVGWLRDEAGVPVEFWSRVGD